MKASFLTSEVLEVETSLAFEMFWLSKKFQQSLASSIFTVLYGKSGFCFLKVGSCLSVD